MQVEEKARVRIRVRSWIEVVVVGHTRVRNWNEYVVAAAVHI